MSELIVYEISYSPFRIKMQINGETLIVVNEDDSLLFEDYRRFQADIDNPVSEKRQQLVTLENINKDPFMPILNLISPYI